MSKIGFIGAGNMGGALIEAACHSISAEEVVITSKHMEKTRPLTDRTGCRAVKSNKVVAKEAEYIVLAVKPHLIREVTAEIAPEIKEKLDAGEKKVLVTIAAGVPIAAVREALGFDMPIIRIMPNTPVQIGAGTTLICADNEGPCAVDRATRVDFANLIAASGDFEEIDEKAMDYTTAVSSCSPAYVYMFIEAMADGAVTVGVPREQAIKLAAQTVLGAAAMVVETGEHPEALKDKVCSPGGSTIAGVNALEEHGFRYAVSQAIVQATKKNQELGK